MRTALREATGAVHERLHLAPPFADLANQKLDLAGYRNLLASIAAFHFTVRRGGDIEDSRLDLLASDLEALGTPAPLRSDWNFPRTAAERLGLAYVVEGSSLGGKVIYRQLDYLFENSPAGRRFFRGTSSDGARWQALCRKLETEGQAPGAIDGMISGAAATFALFEQLVVGGSEHD